MHNFNWRMRNGKTGNAQRQRRPMSRLARLQKPDDRLLIDWAYALDCAGEPDQAVAKVREAIKTQPSAHSYAVIGMIYGKQGRAQEASKH